MKNYLNLLSRDSVSLSLDSCFTRIIDNNFKKNAYLKKPVLYNIAEQSDLFSYEERKLAIGSLLDELDNEFELKQYNNLASYNIKDTSDIFSDQQLELFLGSSLLDALCNDSY